MLKRFLLALGLALSAGPAFADVDGDCDFVQGKNSLQQLADNCAEEIGAILTTLSGLPSVYAPLAHGHVIADVTGLTAALAGKLDASTVSAFALTLLDDASAAAMRSTLGLGTAALNATGDFAPADPTLGTQTQGSYVAGLTSGFGIAITGTPGEGWSPGVAVALSGTLTDENCVTYEATGPALEVQSCGSGDAWTYVRLTSDATTSATSASSTGLFFTPAASKRYEIVGSLIIQAAATTTGPRPAFDWPTGVTDGSFYIVGPTAGAGDAIEIFAPHGSTANLPLLGLPVADTSYMVRFDAILITGGSPSGNFTVTLASEVAASTVRVMSGSFIRYREIP